MAKAKKKAAAAKPEKPVQPNESKGGPGRKICPGCVEAGHTDCYVVGPAKDECPKCGHKFEIARRGGSSPVGSKDTDRQAVLEAVYLCGSEATLVQELELLKNNQAQFLVDKLGGVDKALAAVEKLKAWRAARQTPIK